MFSGYRKFNLHILTGPRTYRYSHIILFLYQLLFMKFKNKTSFIIYKGYTSYNVKRAIVLARQLGHVFLSFLQLITMINHSNIKTALTSMRISITRE
jgi:hypothetical protein